MSDIEAAEVSFLPRVMPESDSWFYYGVLATEAAQRLWRSGSYPSETLLSL